MKAIWKKIFANSYLRFVLGSIIIFFFEYFVTILLAEILVINEYLSFAISLLLGLYLLFYYHKKISFKLCSHNYLMIIKFLVLYGGIYALNWVIVYLLQVLVSYKFSIPIVAIILSILSYVINKNWVFVPDPKEEQVCKIDKKWYEL